MSDKGESLTKLSGADKRRDSKIAKKAKAAWDSVITGLDAQTGRDQILQKIETEYLKLFKELSDSYKEMKLKDRMIQQLEKDVSMSHLELNKCINAKTRMEQLARELQKQNKEIKDENFNRLKEEEEKRKEVSAKFTEKLNSIATLMQENKEKSIRLQDDNISMTTKLSELYKQFAERENHLSDVNNKMELQKELSDTQMKQVKVGFEVERRLWNSERDLLFEKLQKKEEENVHLRENIKSLETSLSTYQVQYNEFKSTMERSNQVFDSFKTEISKMHKSNAALEKERNEWHNRWKTEKKTLCDIASTHQQHINEVQALKRKLNAMEKLCRRINLERSAYLEALKANNIQALVPQDNETEERELTDKEKELMALKQQLAVLENQQAVVVNGVGDSSTKMPETPKNHTTEVETQTDVTEETFSLTKTEVE